MIPVKLNQNSCKIIFSYFTLVLSLMNLWFKNLFLLSYLSFFQNTRRCLGKTSLCISKKVYFSPWLINNVYLFDRKISFKNYEERKAAAEKICKEAEQLENLFSKLTTTKSKVDANFLFQSLLQ